MNKIIVIDYDEQILRNLNNRHIIVCADTLDHIEHKFAESRHNNMVMAMCVNLPYTSISQIEFKKEWEQIPLIIYAYNIGDYNTFFSKVDLIRMLNIRLFLCNDNSSIYTDLKIMASLGIDCGLLMGKEIIMNDESFLDLASYYYMSQALHATIEPFDYILKHLMDEKSDDFRNVYFDNPLLFTHINSINDIKLEEIGNDDISLKLETYYQHFIDLDNCSKCSAFKICDKHMQNKLSECQNTMNEVYEYAELRNEMNKQNNPKTVCQL